MTTEQRLIEKLEELVEIQNRMIYEKGGLKYPPSKVLNDIIHKRLHFIN